MRALGVWVAVLGWLAVACGAADDSPVGGSSATGGSAGAGAGGTGAAAAGGSTATGGGAGAGGNAGAGGQAATPTIFSDGFESADMSATNPEGFAWSNNNRTSVVTADAAVWNNGVIDNPRPAGSDWTPFEGAHSLRFRYPANEPWSEQRFDLGQPHTELWFRWWIRVPINYVHGALGSPARNQKFFSLWMDGYSGEGDGSTVWLGFHPTGDGTDSTLGVTHSPGGYTSSVAYQQHVPFIDSSEDRGRWMRVVFHVRAESSDGAADGVMETWRRWEDETTYTKLHDVADVPLRVAAAGPHGFQAGYLMGWANGHYEEDTEWLLDLFEISDEPLTSQ